MLRSGAITSIVEIAVTTLLLVLVYRIIVNQASLEVLGVWSLLVSLTSLARFIDFGIAGSLSKFIGEVADNNRPSAWRYIDTALAFNAMLYTFVGLISFYPLGWAVSASLPHADAAMAIEALPVVIANLTLSSIAVVPTTALIGLRLGSIKSMVNTAGAVVLLVTTILLLPRLSLLGLVLAQTCQNLFILVASWLLLTRTIDQRLGFRIPTSAEFGIFRKTMFISLKMQANSLLSFLYEVVLKLVISVHGGPAILGLYELADRFFKQGRQVIVSPSLISVPFLARAFATGRKRAFRNMYDRQLLLTLGASILVFVAIMLLAPLVSIFVLNHLETELLLIMVICGCASVLNAVSVPAHMLGLASGRLRGNLAGNALTLIGVTVVGYGLGAYYGGVGAVLGGGISLGAGAILTILMNSKLFGVRIFPQSSEWVSLFSIAGFRRAIRPLIR